MRDTDKSLRGIIKSAAFAALIGAIISFEVCMLILGSNLFEKLLPIEITAGFTILYAILDKLGLFKRRRALGIGILAATAVLAVVLLLIFC